MEEERSKVAVAEAPPVIVPVQSAAHSGSDSGKKVAGWGSIGAFLLVLLGKLKFLLPALKILKLGKILTTTGTMFLSMWAYSVLFGWPFAVGFVLLILIHEMGHVYVGWKQGRDITAPVFIPFMGAVIFSKQPSPTAWGEAIMGIGGPVAGALGAAACHLIFLASGSTFFLGLAYIGYFLNLFNLMPVPPLDGGWITGAISPILWLFGMVALVTGYIMGWFHNPFLIVLVLLSLPRLWHGLFHKGAPPGGIPATPVQRVIMGVSYVGLAGALLWGMTHTFEHPQAARPANDVPRVRAPVA